MAYLATGALCYLYVSGWWSNFSRTPNNRENMYDYVKGEGTFKFSNNLQKNSKNMMVQTLNIYIINLT